MSGANKSVRDSKSSMAMDGYQPTDLMFKGYVPKSPVVRPTSTGQSAPPSPPNQGTSGKK